MEMEKWIGLVFTGGVVLILTVAAMVCLYRRKKRIEAAELTNCADSGAEAGERSFARQFLPLELLEILGTGRQFSGAEEMTAHPKELEAVIYNGNIAGFHDIVRGMDTGEVYQFINRSLSCSIPAVYEHGGVVEEIRDAGITALFNGSCEESLKAAVAICEEMFLREKTGCFRNFTTGLCYGLVQAGVVGCGQRLAVHTLSAYTGLATFLQQIGMKYYARILAVGSYVDRIDGFQKKYNCRRLGYIFLGSLQQMELLYDIFDGDDADTRNRKRKTKMLFEKGVQLFLGRQYADARVYFIEVLKADSCDKAAREYVFLCDKYRALSEKERAEAPLYIESV